MRPFPASLLTAALLLPLLGCGQEPEPASLLCIEDRVFEMRDFREHLRMAHPTVQPPIERLVLNRILEEFKERKLLAYAAAKAGVGVPRDADSPFERETALIGRYLAQEAYRRLQIDEESVESLYRERYVHPRVDIRSVLLPDETTARNVYSRLRRNRSQFEQY